jgi:hypothetical protein
VLPLQERAFSRLPHTGDRNDRHVVERVNY